MSGGRPIEPVPQQLADDLVVWIERGETLRAWCRLDGHPHYSTVYDWEAKDADFAQRIARARVIGHDVIAEHCMAIADEEPICIVPDPDGGTSSRIDTGGIQRNKLRIDTRLKLLAKWNPRKYGDKSQVELGGKDGAPIESNIVISFVKARESE